MSNYKRMRVWDENKGGFKKCLENSSYRLSESLHLLKSKDRKKVYNANKSLLWAGFSQLEIEQILNK